MLELCYLILEKNPLFMKMYRENKVPTYIAKIYLKWANKTYKIYYHYIKDLVHGDVISIHLKNKLLT